MKKILPSIIVILTIISSSVFADSIDRTGKTPSGFTTSQNMAQEEVKKILLELEPRCENFEGSSWESCRIVFNKIDDTSVDVDVIVPDYGETKYLLEKQKGTTGPSWKLVSKKITKIF